MIIVMCNDDPALWQSAQRQAGPVFGQVFQFIGNNTPQLGQHESLFILAHGLPGVIGNQYGPGGGYSALDLWNYLSNTTPNGRRGSIFPANYMGNIYVWACYPANITRKDRLSFIENLYAISNVWLANTRVYGVAGAVDYVIADPGNSAWVRATI